MEKIKQQLNYLFNCLKIAITNNDIRCKLPSSTFIGHNCIGTIIGENVIFGENCKIRANTNIGTPKKYEKEGIFIYIGDNVDIGIKSSIMNRSFNNMFIGDNSVIYAGSMVLKSVPVNSKIRGLWK